MHREWKPCNREELKRTDPAIYELLNSDRYRLPNTIPFGEYGGNDVSFHGYEVEVRKTTEGDRFFVNRNHDTRLSLRRGNTYYFDQSLRSNAGHALRFATERGGRHGVGQEYARGVTSRGRPGERGAYVRIKIPKDDAPDELYPYCGESGVEGKMVFTIEPGIESEM
ncbi:MAG: hypothetical protein AAF517_07940 [Planctomycetota bacterium]